MIQVLELEKSYHRKSRPASSNVSPEPSVCPGVGNMNNMPVSMNLSGRDGNNLLASALSATAISAGRDNLLVIFIFSGVYMN